MGQNPQKLIVEPIPIWCWPVISLGIIWVITGLIGILAPLKFATDTINFIIGPAVRAIEFSGIASFFYDNGSGLYFFCWPGGRMLVQPNTIGLGLAGLGTILSLAPYIVLRRLAAMQTITQQSNGADLRYTSRGGN